MFSSFNSSPSIWALGLIVLDWSILKKEKFMKNNEKKKFNPFKSIAFCLCTLMFVASFTLFAVSLALSLVDITAGGHISFTASGVYAKVTGSVTGTKTTNNPATLTFDASTENFTTPDSWKNMTFDFTSANLITFTVNFQNLSTENPLYVTFTDGLTVTNVTTTRTLDGSSVTTFPTLEVPVITTKTAIMTFKVDDIYKSVSSDFSLNMKLTDSDPDVLDSSTYTMLDFTYDDETQSASVRSAKQTVGAGPESYEEYLATGNVTIPSKVRYNSVVYKITSIEQSGFSGCDITTINIPASVTSIGKYAFQESDYQDHLTNVTFEITEGWKAGSTSLSSADLAKPVTAANYLANTYRNYDWTRS